MCRRLAALFAQWIVTSCQVAPASACAVGRATTPPRAPQRYRTGSPASAILLLGLITALLAAGSMYAARAPHQLRHPETRRAVAAPSPAPPSSILLVRATKQPAARMIAIIQQVWGRAWRIGVAIARCESGLRPAAVHYNRNGTWDAGLFQINQVHGIPKAQLLNPSVNARYAYQLYVKQGTRPWRASQRCWARVV